MSIVDTVEEIQTFLDEEKTVTLMADEPTKFMVDLKNLLDEVVSAAEDIQSAVETAIDAVEELRTRAEDVVADVDDAISELECVK